jgi:branched-chain amino acid:cation transporter, LIVCS family
MSSVSERANRGRDLVVVGFAMFAVFFGAGNLIFPPHIGFQSGNEWPPALLGLLLTGMLLPMMSVLAVGVGGGTFERLTRPIAPWFGTLVMAVTLVTVAWLITIPRTAAVAYETGIRTLAPGIEGRTISIVFLVVYFAISLYFAIDRSSVIDKIGKILTPLLLILLVGIVLRTILAPLGEPVATGVSNPFHLGFTTGYQTGDVLTGLLFGILFIDAIKAKGHGENAGFIPVLLGAIFITFLGLFIVYGGLLFLGATGSGLFPVDITRPDLLTSLVARLAGNIGAQALAVAVILACLTTAVGATAVMATYIANWSDDRISYRTGAIITTVVSMFQAYGGVDYIVGVAGPIFMLLYPVAICIAVLGVFARMFNNDGVWKGMAIMAVLIGIYDSLAITGEMLGFALPDALREVYGAIPFSEQGFAWVVPSIAGAIVGGSIWKVLRLPSVGNGPGALDGQAHLPEV